MPECLPTDALASDAIAENLRRHGRLIVAPVGTSMRPLLHGSRDAVALVAPTFPLRKYDVALYRRGDGKTVLHRVMWATGHSYVFCGDNLTELEPPVGDDAILAVMAGYFHRERYVDVQSPLYRLYCRLWCGGLLPRKLAAAALLPARLLYRRRGRR